MLAGNRVEGDGAVQTLPPYRRIVLCADDYGISPGVNRGIRELIMQGRLNATSVMVAAPSFDRSEAASLNVLNAGAPRVAIGLHVTLTAPFRPLSQGFRPLREGAFLPLDAMLARSVLRLLSRRALMVEIATQLKAFLVAFGRVPDFVDGHQHVHLFPQVRDAVLKIVHDNLPSSWVRQCGSAVPLKRQLSDRKGLLLDLLSRSFRRRASALGVTVNPAFAGTYEYEDPTPGDFAELFPKFIERIPPKSVVMCHPGYVDAELERLDPLTALRERELRYLSGDRFPEDMRARGVGLT